MQWSRGDGEWVVTRPDRTRTGRHCVGAETSIGKRSSRRSVNCCRSGRFSELSVSTISLRAGVARSGFYFYFDSKYSVLAQILAEAAEELEERTQYFAPRQPGVVAGAVRQTNGRQCRAGVRATTRW